MLHGCQWGRLAHGEHVHTQHRLLPTRSFTHCSETHPCAAGPVCAQPSRRHQTRARPHMHTRSSTAPRLQPLCSPTCPCEVRTCAASHTYTRQKQSCAHTTRTEHVYTVPQTHLNTHAHAGTDKPQIQHVLCTYCTRCRSEHLTQIYSLVPQTTL